MVILPTMYCPNVLLSMIFAVFVFVISVDALC